MSCILLLLNHQENRRLLSEWLMDQYQVLSPKGEDKQMQMLIKAECDLVIVDGAALHHLQREVKCRRQAEEPSFLPFLLVSTQMDSVPWDTPTLWQRLDEHITIPCPKSKLQTRISTLLRARHLSLELEEATQHLQDINQMKSEFISIVSHEFRNPLHLISGYTQVLEQSSNSQSSDTQNTLFEGIYKSVKKLDILVSDLLVLGRTGTSRLCYSPESLNLDIFCRTLLAEVKLATDAQQNIAIQIDGNFSEVVMDPKLLNHILSNVVSNAIKYSSPQSQIYFTLSAQVNMAEIVIKDEGIGIPIDSQPKLFGFFHRASNVGNTPGTGLGLMITKQCVELHHGQIEIASEPNVGTTCSIKLPIHLIE